MDDEEILIVTVDTKIWGTFLFMIINIRSYFL